MGRVPPAPGLVACPRRPPDRVVNFANIVGFVLLIGLMLFVLGLDIARHFLGLL